MTDELNERVEMAISDAIYADKPISEIAQAALAALKPGDVLPGGLVVVTNETAGEWVDVPLVKD